jgi:hypothetical protein
VLSPKIGFYVEARHLPYEWYSICIIRTVPVIGNQLLTRVLLLNAGAYGHQDQAGISGGRSGNLRLDIRDDNPAFQRPV